MSLLVSVYICYLSNSKRQTLSLKVTVECGVSFLETDATEIYSTFV